MSSFFMGCLRKKKGGGLRSSTHAHRKQRRSLADHGAITFAAGAPHAARPLRRRRIDALGRCVPRFLTPPRPMQK
jgi:hypothetical protein